MKIAGIVHTLNVYGGVKHYFQFGNEAVRQGHEFHLFTKFDGQEKEAWMPFSGVIRNHRDLASEEFDCVWTGDNNSFPSLETCRAKVKIIRVVAKFYANDYKKWWDLVGNDYLWIGIATDWNLGMEEIQGVMIPQGINTDFFTPALPKPDILTVCFYGRYGSGRGVERCVSIAENVGRRAKEMGKQIQFISFDHAGYHSYCDHNAENTKFVETNTQEELRNVYRQSHFVLSFMNSAGWNNTVSEGMCCGAIPICNRSGTIDFVRDKQTGFLCETDDEAVSVLCSLASRDTREIEKIGRNAYLWANQFSIGDSVRRFVEEVEKRLK